MRRTLGALVALVLVLVTSGSRMALSQDACTDPDNADLLPECMQEGTYVHFLRQLCSYQWVEETCASTLFEDPGYATDVEPNPKGKLRLKVGAVHEHSSYSDGDPTVIPRDYYNTAKTGHNVADVGGDTGIKLDFMWGSEHSDNAQIPITTAAACLDPIAWIECSQIDDQDHYWKWQAELRQAREATDDTFTAMRGFEWTNDYFNHMNVYFSRNYTNVKVDGSYASMDIMWDWLRKPVQQGGGSDALLTFNHPGGNPALTPFDGDQPHNEALNQLGNSNWDDVAYVPDVDARVAGMEVNGGDDIEWYVKALTKGWHIGAVANEDEHQREWATSKEGKTLIVTRGETPKDYYYAFSQHRTIAIHDALVDGAPGEDAKHPSIFYWADGKTFQHRSSTLLGSTITKPGAHTLRFKASDLPPGSRVAVISNTTGGQATPIQAGNAAADGSIATKLKVSTPATGEDWYFFVVCPAEGATPCGSDRGPIAITAPIWLASAA